ncbi:MAG: FkbM family methyltransferase [Blautia sp.]|nr:FkbM family methyltransferase [Blautia sp.]
MGNFKIFSTFRSRLEKNKRSRNLLMFLRKIGAVNILHFFEDLFRSKKSCDDFNKFCKDNAEKLKNIFDMLDDEKSKRVFENILRYRASYNRKYLRGIIDGGQYFDKDIMRFSDDEVMVDCGAYIGDTIEEFVKRNSEYKHIYALEPDNNIIAFLKENARSAKDRLTIFPVAAWSKKETLSFADDGIGTGHVGRGGGRRIEADSIDNLLSGAYVSFIKMDIEGAEMEALTGACRTIQENKPKLAICIYHKYEDLYRIPMYVKSLVPEYRIYIRHYSDTPSETVMYAIT